VILPEVAGPADVALLLEMIQQQKTAIAALQTSTEALWEQVVALSGEVNALKALRP
jgi:hypothetical protein